MGAITELAAGAVFKAGAGEAAAMTGIEALSMSNPYTAVIAAIAMASFGIARKVIGNRHDVVESY